MRALSVTASLFTAVVLAVSSSLVSASASAADLGEGYPEGPDDRDGYSDNRYPPPPYEDEAPPPHRYSQDRYNQDRHGEEPDERYSDRAGPGPGEEDEYDRGPRQGSIKDGYPVPVPPPRYSDQGPPRFSDRAPPRYACLNQWDIRRRLRGQGWGDLGPAGVAADGPILRVRGRRLDSGRVFVLRVDRCSGEILAARPQYLRNFGAFEQRPWPGRRWAGRRDY